MQILKSNVHNPSYQIAALVTDENGVEHYESYTKDGKYYGSKKEDHRDLMMVTTKHEGWVNIYFNSEYEAGINIYSTKEDAISARNPDFYVSTVFIEWED